MLTPSRLLRAFVVALAIFLAATAWTPTRLSAQGGPRERTLYVSAVDAKGEPVNRLGPDDFVVREDGATREVLRVTRATEPIDIAILVDNSGASDGVLPRVREGLTSFVTAMSEGNRNQIAI